MKTGLNILEKERSVLMSKWATATGSEKTKLLVRIMDIDEQLEVSKKKGTEDRLIKILSKNAEDFFSSR